MSLIVIVDDRVVNRSIYSRLVQSIGETVEVKAFGDPGEALAWLEGAHPDLIVTDYDMPKIDGDEFITRFRALPHAAGVPIMMVTVCDQRLLRLRALESGANDFLHSPIDHNEFLMRARNLLKLRRGAEGPSAARSSPPVAPSGAREALLAQCGEGAYALHVVLSQEPLPEALVEALRQDLRAGDGMASFDGGLVLLQKEVVEEADVEACALRLRRTLRGADAVLIGCARPVPGETTPVFRAEACLRAAEADAAARPPSAPVVAAPEWRFQPRIALRGGAIVGARLLRGAEKAGIADSEALLAATDMARRLGDASARPVRIGLACKLVDPAAPLRLAAALARTGAAADQFELEIGVEEVLALGKRAEEAAGALRMLGVGLTLDLSRGDARSLVAASPHWKSFARSHCDCLAFSGRTGGNAMLALDALLALAASLRRGLGRMSLLAEDVASTAHLVALRRAEVALARGGCLGAAFSPDDFAALLVGPCSAARRA